MLSKVTKYIPREVKIKEGMSWPESSFRCKLGTSNLKLNSSLPKKAKVKSVMHRQMRSLILFLYTLSGISISSISSSRLHPSPIFIEKGHP